MTKKPQEFRIQERLPQKPVLWANCHDSRQDVFVLQQSSITKGVAVQLGSSNISVEEHPSSLLLIHSAIKSLNFHCCPGIIKNRC